jgi:hypothetical protein
LNLVLRMNLQKYSTCLSQLFEAYKSSTYWE